MSEIPLPPGFKWDAQPPAAPPPVPGPILPPSFRWEDQAPDAPPAAAPPPNLPDTTTPPNMRTPGINPPGTAPPGVGIQPDMLANATAMFTGDGRAINPATKRPYPEIRDLLPMLPQEIIPGVLAAPKSPKGAKGTPTAGEVESTFAMEGDEPLRAAWLAKRFPNAEVKKIGREVIVNIKDINPNTGTPYGEFTLNRVGWSAQDTDEILQEIAMAGPAMRLATVGKTLLRRALGAGVGSAGESAVRQGASQLSGTGRVTSLPEVATAGLAGGILTGMGEHGFRVMKRLVGQKALVDVNGQITAQADALLRRLGVPPDQITMEAIRELEMVLHRARNPAEALRLAQARSVGVTPTRGDVTGERSWQALEGRVATGHPLGPVMTPAERRLADLKGASAAAPRGQQGQQIDHAVGDVAEQISGRRIDVDPRTGSVTTPRGEFFGQAQQRLVDLYERSRREVGRLYQSAMNNGAEFTPDKVRQLSFELQRIKEGTRVPAVHGIADDLAGMIKAANAGGVVPIPLRDMEVKIRQQISELGASLDPRDRAMARRMRRAYDDWESNITQADLARGTTQAFADLQEGRRLRIQQAANFEDDPAIAAILKAERMPSATPGGAPTYKIDMNPSEAVDAVLGSGSARHQADRAQRIRNVLGENSDEWRAVKAEMVARLMEGSPTGLTTRFNALVRKNRELVDIVFNRDDIARIRTLADVTNFTGYRPTSDVNYRGLAYEIARSFMPHKFGISNAAAAMASPVRPGPALQPLIPPAGPGGMVGMSVVGGQQITPDRIADALRAVSPNVAPAARPVPGRP